MKLTCSILIILIGANLYAQEHLLYREIDQIIRMDTEIPYPIDKSFIVGIIKDDSTYVLNYGSEHIDTFERFEIGGLTKAFTATLATRLEEEKQINLESSINSYLPKKYQNPTLSDYTLSDLLLHQISFPKRPSNLAEKEYDLSNPYKYYTKTDLLNYYKAFENRKFDSWRQGKLRYSHINYALLEIILEEEMQMSLEDLFQFYLFQDLAMNHTSLKFSPTQIKIGFDRSNMIPDIWEFQSFAGSEGLVSCLGDLLIFTKRFIDSSEPYIVKALDNQENGRVNRKLGRSYAWYTLSSKKTGRIYSHSGVSERHKAYIHFQPESKTGVVILCQSSQGVEELGMLILRLINKNWKKNG